MLRCFLRLVRPGDISVWSMTASAFALLQEAAKAHALPESIPFTSYVRHHRPASSVVHLSEQLSLPLLMNSFQGMRELKT